jgi:hypothetical protein
MTCLSLFILLLTLYLIIYLRRYRYYYSIALCGIKSYLSSRTLKIKDYLFSFFPVLSGVAQSSALGVGLPDLMYFPEAPMWFSFRLPERSLSETNYPVSD